MHATRLLPALLCSVFLPGLAGAGAGHEQRPLARMIGPTPSSPVPNAAFAPGSDALPAPAFTGRLQFAATPMLVQPALSQAIIDSRDARLFPGIDLALVTVDGALVPAERGRMVREARAGTAPSYWRVIPQAGRVWREPGDGDWSRAALPLMLVNDTENHAHQGLATFLYRNGEVSAVRVQFVQQTAPYLLSPHCVLWGIVPVRATPLAAADAETTVTAARRQAAVRANLPVRPLAELEASLPRGTLDGFGGPVLPDWQVARALVYRGTLYYEAATTPYGPYPYPLEMRFGVRSIMKSVAGPLSLLHLAQVYGPYVMNLYVGDYVEGLDPKWKTVRFADAASMASGYGGTGTLRTHPNDFNDGYLDGDYDGWYTAPSVEAKLRHMREHLTPYPWAPGTVARYRDHDFFVLGLAIDGFIKKMRGPQADAWEVLRREVLEPIGIFDAPAVRTREADGREGPVWFNAGYYPTLEDLARIALLYQNRGESGGQQLLHRGLCADLLAAKGALDKQGDGSYRATLDEAHPPLLYRTGFHFTPYRSPQTQTLYFLPTMSGYGDNEVVLYPNGIVSLRTAKVGEVPVGQTALGGDPDATIRAVERIAPF
ncbi:MAG: hypothetical protein ACR2I8_01655 [Steroidobacteraceae bacterium]